MAIQDSENPSLFGPRLSPGDAAFERLTRREALRAKEEPDPLHLVSSEAEFVGPPARPVGWTPQAEAEAAPAPIVGPVDPPASDLAILPSPSVAPASAVAATEKAPAEEPADRVLAVAAALGIDVVSPAQALPASIEPASSAPLQSAPPSSPDATAARLEAALLDQLKSLEETLIEDAPLSPPRLPRAEPLRPSKAGAEVPDVVGPPKRSVFAPDPVRQRTYIDLRKPAPEPEKVAADDPPWRKYLAEPRRPGAAVRVSSQRPAPRPAPQASPVVAAIYDRKAEAEERGRGIRAMTAAAVLGLGVGLGLLVLIRPFNDAGSATSAASVSEISAQAVASTGPRAGSEVNQALATLLADPPGPRAAPGQPAVISETGATSPAAIAAASPAPAPAAAVAVVEPPVVIRPPPGEAERVARVPDFDAARSVPLAYVPATPSFDPVRQSLLEREAGDEPQAETGAPVSSRAAVADKPARADIRPGRATINSFVNLRSKPDNTAPVVAILAEGLSVRVIACDYWCEVEAGGKRGFVFQKFVTR